jgi:flagellar basal-body rod modification protein FlgD
MTIAQNSAASTSSSSTSNSAAAATTSALTELAGNFNEFLSLLTTQLQNQDPTRPMDTSQFTSELVQFTGVAEQVNTNQTLGQLLTASLAQQLTQASGLVGKQVSFSGGSLPLQNGSATVDYQATAAGPVQITVSDASGNTVDTQTVTAASGSNTWTWNGKNANGQQLPDGAYTVGVTQSGVAVPFQAVGTVTGAQQSNQAVNLLFGADSVGFGQIVSLSPTTAN